MTREEAEARLEEIDDEIGELDREISSIGYNIYSLEGYITDAEELIGALEDERELTEQLAAGS